MGALRNNGDICEEYYQKQAAIARPIALAADIAKLPELLEKLQPL